MKSNFAHKIAHKAIQAKILTSQGATSNVIVAFTKEIQRRSDQVYLLSVQPFFRQDIRPPVEEIIRVDFEDELDTSNMENSKDMSFKL